MAQRKPIKKEVYVGVAIRTQSAFLGGKQYNFKVGERYEIDKKEVFEKLTNKIQPVLRGV